MDDHHVGYIKKIILKKNSDTYLAYFEIPKNFFGKAPLMWHHLIVFIVKKKLFFLFQWKKGTLFWGGLYSSFVFSQLPEPQILAYCKSTYIAS
jgi:hypothetical protein